MPLWPLYGLMRRWFLTSKRTVDFFDTQLERQVRVGSFFSRATTASRRPARASRRSRPSWRERPGSSVDNLMGYRKREARMPRRIWSLVLALALSFDVYSRLMARHREILE